MLGTMFLVADHEPASVSTDQDGSCATVCRTYLWLTLGIKQYESSLYFKVIVTFLRKVTRCIT